MILIQDDVKKIIYQISPNSAMNFLNSKDTWLEKDIFNIASIVFNIETSIKMGKKVYNVKIPISLETATDRDIQKIEKLLNQLFMFVLIEDVEIKFDLKDMRKNRRKRLQRLDECENVCLFSGGVDSLSGLLSSKKHFGEVHAVYAAHGDLSWGSNIVNHLMEKITKVEDIPYNILYAPEMGSRGYSQLRGFLYVLFGAIYVSLLNSKNLIIAECGSTMYQPRFSAYDTVTMTTHPYIMNIAKEIVEIMLKRKINFIIPHENMTKAEVIMAAPYKEFFKDSHSCISLRFGKNEGTCYGCIVRRLGFLVSGVEDTKYTRDPIGNIKDNADNLASLLSFSEDVLFNYSRMPYYSKDIIAENNKRDLFQRFALDNISALYVYKDSIGKLNSYIDPLYTAAFKRLGEEKILKRIDKVRRSVFKPNFNKYV